MKSFSFGRFFLSTVAFLFFGVTGSGCHSSRCNTIPGEPSKFASNEVVMNNTGFSFSNPENSYNIFPPYKIVPSDVLDVLFQVNTWAEVKEFRIGIDATVGVKFVQSPELNETQRVRPDGKISLPYLGEVRVVGKTVAELTKDLKQQYAKILKEPELYVTVPEFSSGIKELKSDLHTSARGLSRLVTVRPDGYATFPMVGDILVANRTVPEVSAVLNERYNAFLPGLHVDLFLEQYSGSNVSIIGMVYRPGVYQMKKPVTILEAIALAGGYQPGAQLSSVVVMRKLDDKIIARRVNANKNLSLRKGGQFFYLQPDDIVYVPKTIISKGAELARDLQDLTFFRGVGITFAYDLNDEPERRSVVTTSSQQTTGDGSLVVTETSEELFE